MIRTWCCLFIALSFASHSLAHPHVWVDSEYRINIEQTQISTFEGTWSLDLFTSTSLIAEYDTNFDGAFTGQEKIDLIEVLTSFDQYGYFMKLKLDGKDLIPQSVRVKNIGIRDQMLWLTLDVTLPQTIDLQTSTLSLAYGDDELYFAMEPLEAGLVHLSGPLSELCTPLEREAFETSVAYWIDLSCQS
ncbi:DUF1007 family protein [Marinomonas sp. C2222]|uniref:DUF1007 family protein n=1 Tax=Marinomonas sargassi TaxID=2984494 RepID=A0ABT2YPJ4_9GAMM|nr:DUF1007 family protein [Marinomonas sargassi]MCV2401792.1 DUF1007 family protein [Marinomonas sargassi]